MALYGRDMELKRLRDALRETRRSGGRVVLIEGTAGIGKSSLVEEFLKDLDVAKILRYNASKSSKVMQYSALDALFKEQGGIEGIMRVIRFDQIRHVIEESAENAKMVLLSIEGAGVQRAILQELSKRNNICVFSTRKPARREDVWITEIGTNWRSVDPHNLEFEILPAILDSAGRCDVVVVDGLGYLLAMNGLNRTEGFLHSLRDLLRMGKSVIVMGNMGFAGEGERDTIFSLFDDIIRVEFRAEIEDPRVILVENPPEGGTVISSPGRGGDYVIGMGALSPYRLEFEITDTIIGEMEKGNDIVLDCIPYLVHYNGYPKVYTWVKKMVDLADKYGVKLYLVTGMLSGEEAMHISTLADADRSGLTEKIGADMEIYRGALKILRGMARDRPVILVIENVHNLDRGSFDFIRYIAKNSENSQIMIILTYRGEEIVEDMSLLDILQDIRSLENTDVIRLSGLDVNSIHLLLTSRFGEVDIGVSKEIWELSNGNPLLAVTIFEHRVGGGSTVDTLGESIRYVIEKLNDVTLQVLRLAAINGGKIEKRILDRIIPGWNRYFEQNPLSLSDEEAVWLKHEIYGEYIYDFLSPDLRILLHRRLGEVYLGDGMKERAAHHLYNARDRRAYSVLLELGDYAMGELLIDQAISYYTRAMEIARKFKLDGKEIMEKLGDAHFLRGNYQEAMKFYSEGIQIADERKSVMAYKLTSAAVYNGEASEIVETLEPMLRDAAGIHRGRIAGAIGIAKVHTGEYSEAEVYLDEYMKMARKYGDPWDLAEAHRGMAIKHYYRGEYERALEEIRKSLTYALQIDDQYMVANAYNMMGVLYEALGRYEEAERYYKRFQSIAERIGNYYLLSKAHNNLASLYEYSFMDLRKAWRYYYKHLELSLKLGTEVDKGVAYNNLAIVESRSGDVNKAIRYMKEALVHFEKAGDPHNLANSSMNLGNFYTQAGMYDEALEALNQARKIAEEMGYFEILASTYVEYANLYMDKGDVERAREYIALAEDAASKVAQGNIHLEILENRIYVEILSGNFEEAHKLLDEGYERFEEEDLEEEMIFLDAAKVLLLCHEGRVNEAKAILTKVEEVFKRGDKKKWLADVYLRFGQCLSSKNPRDSRDYLERALTLFREQNNRLMAERVERMLKEIDVTSSRA